MRLGSAAPPPAARAGPRAAIGRQNKPAAALALRRWVERRRSLAGDAPLKAGVFACRRGVSSEGPRARGARGCGRPLLPLPPPLPLAQRCDPDLPQPATDRTAAARPLRRPGPTLRAQEPHSMTGPALAWTGTCRSGTTTNSKRMHRLA
eukprot:scaffold1007_cov364-Prasinococcus_capsulatus_cf.AAC.14